MNNEEGRPENGAARGQLNAIVSFFGRFLRRNFQCRFGVHWVSVGMLTEEHDCPDCGKHFKKRTWPRA